MRDKSEAPDREGTSPPAAAQSLWSITTRMAAEGHRCTGLLQVQTPHMSTFPHETQISSRRVGNMNPSFWMRWIQEEGWGLAGGQDTLEHGGGGSGDRDTQMPWLGSHLSPGTQFFRCLKAGTPLPQTTNCYSFQNKTGTKYFVFEAYFALPYISKPFYCFFSPNPGFSILPFRAEFFSFPFHAIEVNSVYFRSCSLMYQGILLCITSIS